MEIFFNAVLMAVSIVLIVKGGDAFVDAASWMARVSGIPKLIVGATVVSLATTLPELLVSSFAAAKGSTEMCIGNAVGSVSANIGLIMALSLIFLPSVIRRRDYMVKSLLMLFSAAFLVLFGLGGQIGLVPSIFLLLIFAAAMFDNVRGAVISVKAGADRGEEKEAVTKKIVIKNVVFFVVGAAAIVFGSNLLVDSAEFLAAAIGIPERIISITLVAIGTSLPELVTTLTAIAKKEASLSVGNIIGANIIDLTLILPISALISGGALPIANKSIMFLDFPAALITGIVALIPALIRRKFSRWQGYVLLGVYAVYLVLSCVLTFA